MKRSHNILSENKALLLSFTKEQYERAVARSKQHPDRSRDNQSITRGKGLITGCLGEIIVEDFLDYVKLSDDNAREMKDKFNFDILLQDGSTLEVKSKGHSVSDCPSFYDCSVSAINPRQKADYYVFVRIHGKRLRDSYGFDHSNSNKAWICGMKAKESMIQPQRLMKRGTVIQNSSNFNFVAKSSCYQIKISELEPLPKNFGKRIDLVQSGSIAFCTKDFSEFALCSDEDDYYVMQSSGDTRKGFFKGLKELTTAEREHFDKNVDAYLYYNSLPEDLSELSQAKQREDLRIERFQRQ